MKASERFPHLPEDIKRELDRADAEVARRGEAAFDSQGFVMGNDDNGANAALLDFVSAHVPMWD